MNKTIQENFYKITLLLCLLLTLIITQSEALAEDMHSSQENNFDSKNNINSNKGFYIGLGLGQTKINNSHVFSNLDANYNGISNDTKSDSYKAYLGYQFNKNLSVEGGYLNIGKLEYSGSTNSGDVNGTIKYKSGNLDMIGNLPMNPHFSWLGIIGTHRGWISNKVSSSSVTGSIPFSDKNGFSFKYGVGFQYKFNDRVSMKTTAERYNFRNPLLKGSNTTMVAVNLVMPLGR